MGVYSAPSGGDCTPSFLRLTAPGVVLTGGAAVGVEVDMPFSAATAATADLGVSADGKRIVILKAGSYHIRVEATDVSGSADARVHIRDAADAEIDLGQDGTIRRMSTTEATRIGCVVCLPVGATVSMGIAPIGAGDRNVTDGHLTVVRL